jgi:hypothetical protein
MRRELQLGMKLHYLTFAQYLNFSYEIKFLDFPKLVGIETLEVVTKAVETGWLDHGHVTGCERRIGWSNERTVC